MPSMVETVVYRDPWDVDRRLVELQLGPRRRLLKVASIATSAAANTTDFYPANAAGTLAYQHGTAALREEFVGKDWLLDRPDGVEAIRNDALKVKVIFANVDISCDDIHNPKPRSHKGAGAERVCLGNSLFQSLPEYAPRQIDGWATYYLMVDEQGTAELTRPVIKNNTFNSYIERIYLSLAGDLGDPESQNDDGAIDDFDPQVIRK